MSHSQTLANIREILQNIYHVDFFLIGINSMQG